MRDATRTKELIQETALRLFVEQGITETTIRDITSAAKIAEGTMYRHFASKEELAWTLFSENFTAFALELDRLQQGHRTLKAKLDAMIRRFCAFFDEDPILFSYLLLALHGQLKKVTPEMPHPMVVLRNAIAEGMARGEVRKGDPDVAAAMVAGLVLQVAVSRIYGRFVHSLSSLADTIAAASWRVVKG